jgi:hypothetical protein
MQALGQKPLIWLNPDTAANADWVSVTDGSLHFTLDIPSAWQSLAREQPQQRADFEALLASDTQFTMATLPLKAALADIELMLIAMSEEPEPAVTLPGFVIVARSETVGRLSPNEIFALAQQVGANIEIRHTEIFRSFAGDERATLSVTMPATRDLLSCQQHIIQGSREGYLVVGCAPETTYQLYGESIEKILLSFQSLR